MNDHTVVFSIFLIFTGAAIFSTLALYTRQSLLVAYMLLGLLIGPWGLKLIVNPDVIQRTSDVGIIFLLFLIGLNLQPQRLLRVISQATLVTIISSLIFGLIGFLVAWAFRFNLSECLIIGSAMMFSSTIIGLKLLPTTVLHHQHTGEVMIGILLLQDLVAIILLLFIHGASAGNFDILSLALITLSLPGLVLVAYLMERYVINFLVKKFGRVREYIFLVAIAWCLSLSQVASALGLSAEIGAFIAGVALASNPIAVYISESLKPVRDFFLVLFFFSIGAGFNIEAIPKIAVPTVVICFLLLVFKPMVFQFLLLKVKENKDTAWEVGVRLGQVSEFSLLIAYIAWRSALIGDAASALIQAVTIVTFIISSYWVVLRYPTPIAMSEKLRRD